MFKNRKVIDEIQEAIFFLYISIKYILERTKNWWTAGYPEKSGYPASAACPVSGYPTCYEDNRSIWSNALNRLNNWNSCNIYPYIVSICYFICLRHLIRWILWFIVFIAGRISRYRTSWTSRICRFSGYPAVYQFLVLYEIFIIPKGDGGKKSSVQKVCE